MYAIPHAALGLALLLTAACDPGPDAVTTERAARRDPIYAEPEVVIPTLPDLPVVEPGGFAVRYAKGRVSLLSRGASLGSVLEELGRAARFAVIPRSPRTDEAVEVRIEDAPLLEALSRLLADSAWAAEYVVGEMGGHRLARLRVGPAPPGPEPELSDLEKRQAAEFAQALDRELDRAEDDEPAPTQRWTAEDQARFEAEVEADLASADPARRIEAVETLEYASAEDFAQLVRFSRDDPDPAVRVSAIETLDGDDSYGAVKALVSALDDPDPAVVVAAIAAIETVEDDTLAAELEPLRGHPDPAVRIAASEAIESLIGE